MTEASEEPRAFAKLVIVESVGFVLLFSILLIKDRSTPNILAMPTCVIFFLILIFFRLFPSCLASSIMVIVYHVCCNLIQQDRNLKSPS